MKGLALPASKRNVLGKKTRFLRRQGIIPTHLFGHGLESVPLQCDTAELQRIIAQAGTTRLIALEIEGDKQPRSVFIREIQRDACTGALLHIDFYQVRKKERIKVDVPIVPVGEAPALKEKGRSLIHGITSLSVECLPDRLPPQIEVDLSPLEDVEQAIYVKDIAISPDITVITAPDQLVMKVSEARVEKVEEVVVEAEAVEAEAVEVEAPTEGVAEEKPE
ncbi:MAG TPA: 50S ribosomal protein L25 [Dehalococcoidia bacterium]|nr:50S ribosomal protein L25 [Dehalococcoidia bacterium]